MNQTTLKGMVFGLPCFGRMSLGVAVAILRHGGRAITSIDGRGPATRRRAETSGVELTDSIEGVFAESDVVVSIANPAPALKILARFESWGHGTMSRPVLVEANPLRPASVAPHLDALDELGFRVVDAGIVGLPPEGDRRPTLLVSGPDASVTDPLDGVAFDVLHVGDDLGRASVLRMLHVLLSKGINANLMHLMLVAEEQGVMKDLMALLDSRRPDLADRIRRSIPWMPADHERFRTELEEAGAWIEALGWSAGLSDAGREALGAIANCELATETRDDRDAARSAEDTVRVVGDRARVPDDVDAPFILTHMTDDPEEIALASAAGVDRIGPDLETWKKEDRQGGMGCRISSHDPNAIGIVARGGGDALPFCRVDPIHDGSAAQIEQVIRLGVRHVMLPMFRTAEEVRTFVELVAGRAEPVILVETVAATMRLPRILEVPGVRGVHIGLNDLGIDAKMRDRVELLVSPWLDTICREIRERGLPLHIGGVASVADETLPIPPEPVIARLLELGASGSLVTRVLANRCRDLAGWKREVELLHDTVRRLRRDPEHRRHQAVRLLNISHTDLLCDPESK